MDAKNKKTKTITLELKSNMFSKLQKKYIFITQFLNTITLNLSTTTTDINNEYFKQLHDYKQLLNELHDKTKNNEQRDSILTVKEILTIIMKHHHPLTATTDNNLTLNKKLCTSKLPTIQPKNFYSIESYLKKYIKKNIRNYADCVYLLLWGDNTTAGVCIHPKTL